MGNGFENKKTNPWRWKRQSLPFKGKAYLLKKNMPFTTIRVIEEVFTSDQKKLMLEKVTEALIEVCGEKTRQGQWVVIEEVKKGDWSIGGQIANPK